LIFLVTITVILGIGISQNTITGLYVGLFAFSSAMLTQTIWLRFRSRSTLAASYARDESVLRQAELSAD